MTSKNAPRLVALGIAAAVSVFPARGTAAGIVPAAAARDFGPRDGVAAAAPPVLDALPAADDIEPRWGVQVLGIRLASSGYMLDFRYAVTNADKAAPLFTRGLQPLLEDETTGVKTVVPIPPKTGALRSTNRPIAGRTYFMFFANPARHVAAGRPVSVSIGDFKVQHLVVLAEDQPFPQGPRVRALPPQPAPVPPQAKRDTTETSAGSSVPSSGSADPPSDHCAQMAAVEASAATTNRPSTEGQDPHAAHRAAAGGPSAAAQDPHAAHRAAAAAASSDSTASSPGTPSPRDPGTAGIKAGKGRPVSLEVPAVSLIDQDGRKVDLAGVLGSQEPVLVSFLFTTCTTICPVMAATFAQVQKDLGHETIRMVSVSVDPEQDTPARMRDFLERHGARPQWSFLTGTVEQSEAVQRAFDVYRGNKMSHPPVYFLKTAAGSWVRVDGLVSASTLVAEIRRAAAGE